jgi:AcrR family transcriptional regulator
MTTLTRKQREIQQREERILEESRKLLLDQGYHGLSMDRIAEVLEYSKGTIYQHFPNKEEILLALANQAMERRLEMFRRAASFRGGSRERISAVGVAAELFFRLYPHHFQVEHVLRLTSVMEKTSEGRRRLLETCESNCMAITTGIVRDAVAAGDLVLPAEDPLAPEKLVFGLWSLTFGGYSIAVTSPALPQLGIVDAPAAIRVGCNHLLDGCGWLPHSSKIGLEQLWERITTELFREEVSKLQLQAGM